MRGQWGEVYLADASEWLNPRYTASALFAVACIYRFCYRQRRLHHPLCVFVALTIWLLASTTARRLLNYWGSDEKPKGLQDMIRILHRGMYGLLTNWCILRGVWGLHLFCYPNELVNLISHLRFHCLCFLKYRSALHKGIHQIASVTSASRAGS